MKYPEYDKLAFESTECGREEFIEVLIQVELSELNRV